MHDIDNAGIFTGSGPTPTLTANIKDNFVFVPGAIGMVLTNVNGEVTNNDVSNALAGIFDSAPGVHVSSNNVTSTVFAVFLLSSGTVQSNDITNSGIGVLLGAGGANVQSNRITLASTAGIEFGCNAATVAHNTINNAAIGLDQVPSTFTGTNTFANTGFTARMAAARPPLQCAWLPKLWLARARRPRSGAHPRAVPVKPTQHPRPAPPSTAPKAVIDARSPRL